MTRPLLLFITGTVFFACVGGTPERRPSDENSAAAIEQEVERLAAERAGNEALWPGFDPLAIPLAVYDGERTLLFRHPAPPQGFTPVAGAAPGSFAWKGRHEAVTANTNSEIGGVPTATLLVDRAQPGGSLPKLAAVAIHEGFHVYQRERHPGWIGNEVDLLVYPIDSSDLLAFRRLETEALRRALAADDVAVAACWARRALVFRGERYARMDSTFAAYERGTELNEGLATYVEMRAAGRRAVDLPETGFGPAEVRHRAYATGPALALLLDRFKPGWPATLEANDQQTLDEMLKEALGAGNACAFEDAAVAGAEEKARADIEVLAAEREQKLTAFEGKPGWRVVVESGGSEPLWPQGFDPLNVDRIEPERVIHTRFLRLGNDAGKLEVMNAEALTDGAGSHPLFHGIRLVVVTGLVKPEVSEADGMVRVRAAGLTLEFKGASITRSGEVITVRVGS